MSVAGIHSTARRSRLGALRGKGGRTSRAGASGVQGAGAGARLQHQRADRVGAGDLRAHHRPVPDRAAATSQRDRAARRLEGDLVQSDLASAAGGEVGTGGAASW